MDITEIKKVAKNLGQNVYGLVEAEIYLGATFTPKDIQILQTVPFRRSVLRYSSKTHVLVVCGALSLMDIWNAQNRLFYPRSTPWFKDEPFATIKAEPGWYLIRRNPVPSSTLKTWDEQLSLLRRNEQVPSASVLAQAMLMHFIETGQHLFDIPFLRTSDVGYEGFHVNIGYFGTQGISANYRPDDYRDRFVGLASSRKR